MGLGSVLKGIAGPIGNVIGGLFDQKAQLKQNHQADVDWQRNYEMQREFAEHGIRWRVEDAKKAGINPLAALGAQTTSAAPGISVGGADYSMGNMSRDLGQSISRSLNNVMTPEERAMKKLTVESMAIDNAIKKKELEGMETPGIPLNTKYGIPGQAQSGTSMMDYRKPRANLSHPGTPAKEAGAINDYQFVRTDTGLTLVPSEDVKQRIEDLFIPELQWTLRNVMKPYITGSPMHAPPDPKIYKLPRGSNRWKWNRWAGEWQPAYSEPYGR